MLHSVLQLRNLPVKSIKFPFKTCHIPGLNIHLQLYQFVKQEIGAHVSVGIAGW
jgi:hypothetical protein